MENTDSSAGPSPSDLELAVSNIQQHTQLVGYRNLLSYVSALGVKVFPETSFDVDSWTQIGSGSFSTTWEANIVTEKGAVVAVKQPNASFTRASTDVENSIQHEGLASIVQELRILAHAKLRAHPNLPHVLGVFFREEIYPDGIRPCVIFDLATSNLRKYLTCKDAGGISPSELTRLASNAADGIGALHACGLVHGDVKPENILLFMREGALAAAVGDLGTCGAPNQISGIITGTLSYCAPEYLDGSPFADHVNKPSRDVYNYGLLLWSMLTLCKEDPFPRGQQYDIQHNDKAAVKSLLEKIPSNAAIPSFRNAILECVQSSPGNRPSIFEASWTLDPASNMR
jgi:serine/threonine protein kinase